jgi:hypothetical protein
LATALPNKETETVAAAFYRDWICKFSVPEMVVFDRAMEFCNKVIGQLHTLLGGEQLNTSVMHLQTNMATESWNRTFIKYRLRALDGGSTLVWEEWLPACHITCRFTAQHNFLHFIYW